MKKPVTLTAAVALVIILADQVTKLTVTGFLKDLPGRTFTVIQSFFYLRLVHNRGAAFGIGNDYGLLFTFLSLVTVAVLIIFYRRFFARSVLSRVAGGLILGGAVGNLIDRIFRGEAFLNGYVVDFLDFQFGSYHWPAFNLADSAICVGVGILILITLFISPLHRSSGEGENGRSGLRQ